jgi:multidrug resistance efflux pump
MSGVEAAEARSAARQADASKSPPVVAGRPPLLRIVPFLVTAGAIVLAGVFGWAMWEVYMAAPWTRDGIVRAYVITETPQVSGRVVSLPATADQFVHKGDLLIEIEQTDYVIAVSNAEAAVTQAKANLDNRQAEAKRREQLTTLETSVEEQQTYVSAAAVADATYRQTLAQLAQAQVNLARTRIVSPVNGYVTNLTVQVGDYATAGQRALSVVNSDSFWVDGYFEETVLGSIHVDDPATMALMGYKNKLVGHVVGISRGIDVPNAQSDPAGLATVNPVFTWIRLAQRVPVRIAIDHVPPEVTLSIGLTATVTIGHSGGAKAPLTGATGAAAR